jgi:hypothetical protein
MAAATLAACAPTGDPVVRRVEAACDARAVSQLAVSGNACGPAALLNSLRHGDARWRKALASIDGETDRGQLLTIIRRHGLRPSPHLGGRLRWSRRGMNVVDLTDIANEIAGPIGLPEVRHEVLIANSIESTARQLARTHRHLETSLARGLPPMLSIRRYALRRNAAGVEEWTAIDSHFVTVLETPRRLPRNAEAFSISYIDPWGGGTHAGEIRVPTDFSGVITPFLEARFPAAKVGRDRVRPGERTTLVVSAVIGRW